MDIWNIQFITLNLKKNYSFNFICWDDSSDTLKWTLPKTNPGGYVVESKSLEQFEISDNRPTAEVEKIIKQQGYEPVWKNWEKCY